MVVGMAPLTRIAGTVMVAAIAIYWCVTLTGPVPALQHALGDGHAYIATVLVWVSPIALAAYVIAAVMRSRRRDDAIPVASVHRGRR
jgi:hypothetical protein